MPSGGNLNGPCKNRLAARASKAKKVRSKRSQLAKNKISKQDVARGARPGLLPNSGPRAKMSSKKARKLEKKLGYAIQRKLETDGEVLIEDADSDEERQGPDETEMEGIQ